MGFMFVSGRVKSGAFSPTVGVWAVWVVVMLKNLC